MNDLFKFLSVIACLTNFKSFFVASSFCPENGIENILNMPSVKTLSKRYLQKLTFTEHTDDVTALAILSNVYIISGSKDTTIKLWDPSNVASIRTFTEHTNGVTALAVLPKDNNNFVGFISGSKDNTIKLWDPTSVNSIRTFSEHLDDVTSLAVLHDGRFISGSNDNTIKLWDPSNNNSIKTFTEHSDKVKALAVLHDGRFISGSKDTILKLWDPSNNNSIRTYEFLQDYVSQGDLAIAVLPDDNKIAIEVKGWSLSISDNFFICDITQWPANILKSFSSRYTGSNVYSIDSLMAVLPDGTLLTGSNGNFKHWDYSSNTAKNLIHAYPNNNNDVLSIAVFADGRFVSGSGGNSEGSSDFYLWDSTDETSYQAIYTFQEHGAFINSLAIFDNGRVLSADYLGPIKLWDPYLAAAGDTNAVINTFNDHHADFLTSLAIISDNRFISGGDEGTIYLWDISNTDPIKQYDAQCGEYKGVYALATFVNGNFISGCSNGKIKLWNSSDEEGSSSTDPILEFNQLPSAIKSLAVLPDGRFISGDGNGVITLWDISNVNFIRQYQDNDNCGDVFLAVFLDGRFISGSCGLIKLWDSLDSNGESLSTYGDSYSFGGLNSVAVFGDGKTIIGNLFKNSYKIFFVKSINCH